MKFRPKRYPTRLKPSVTILDVDGVITDGQFVYSSEGKFTKTFGPDDTDAISLLSRVCEVRFVTGDKRGFEISARRIVKDLGHQLDLVSTSRRLDWIANLYSLETVTYIGDGIFDHLVLKKVGYGIALANSLPHVREAADFVTTRKGGDRAVAEACLHLFSKFWPQINVLSEEWIAERVSGTWSN